MIQSGICVASSSCEPRHNKWTEFSRCSVPNSGSVTLKLYITALVRSFVSLNRKVPLTFHHTIDVVHAITYSIMLLNTDLHIADIANRMSRSQFIKNTLSVVLDQIDALDVESPYSNPAAVPSTASLDEDEDGTLEGTTPAASSPPSSRPPTVRYHHHPKNRSGSLTSWRSIMQHAGASQSAIQLGSADESPVASRVSLNLPSSTAAETPAPGYFDSPERRASREQVTSGGRKLWEQEMENFLKVCILPSVLGLLWGLGLKFYSPFRKSMMLSKSSRFCSLSPREVPLTLSVAYTVGAASEITPPTASTISSAAAFEACRLCSPNKALFRTTTEEPAPPRVLLLRSAR